MLNRIQYHGWESIRLATSKIELIAPLVIGPRLVSLRRLERGRNIFVELDGQQGGRDEAAWQARGGHRLWHAPEHPERTYQPDNSPPEFKPLPRDRGFELVQPVETRTGMQKTIRVEAIDAQSLRVTHILANRGLWPVETAAWALTMMRVGGFTIVPLPDKGSHPKDLLPEFSLVPWAYTDLSLPAWRFFPGFLRLETRKVPAPQKLGITGYPGWAGYWIDGDLFVKQARVDRRAAYPDRGCVFETFADPGLTELETLSPVHRLEPGRRIVHVETWGLLAGVPKPVDEATYQRDVVPAVTKWLKATKA